LVCRCAERQLQLRCKYDANDDYQVKQSDFINSKVRQIDGSDVNQSRRFACYKFFVRENNCLKIIQAIHLKSNDSSGAFLPARCLYENAGVIGVFSNFLNIAKSSKQTMRKLGLRAAKILVTAFSVNTTN